MMSTGEIIGSVSTLLSGLIVWAVDRVFIFKTIRYETVEKARRKAVTGKWKGTFSQILDGQNRGVPLELTLNVSRNGKLKGEIYFSFNGQDYYIDIWGGFYLQRFLKLEYMNVKREIDQFGSFVLNLSANANTLTGCFVGYGNIHERVISGSVTFKKV